jgi:hypothetical protein
MQYGEPQHCHPIAAWNKEGTSLHLGERLNVKSRIKNKNLLDEKKYDKNGGPMQFLWPVLSSRQSSI